MDVSAAAELLSGRSLSQSVTASPEVYRSELSHPLTLHHFTSYFTSKGPLREQQVQRPRPWHLSLKLTQVEAET